MAETKRVIYYDQLSGNQPTNGDVIFVDNPTTGTHKMDLKSFVDAINNGFDSSIKSSGVSVSADNYSSIITNVNDQPVNSVYTYGAGLQSKVSNLPSNKAMTIVNFAQKSTGGLGQVMLAVERNGSDDYLYFRTIGGSPAVWSSWVKVANNSDVEDEINSLKADFGESVGDLKSAITDNTKIIQKVASLDSWNISFGMDGAVKNKSLRKDGTIYDIPGVEYKIFPYLGGAVTTECDDRGNGHLAFFDSTMTIIPNSGSVWWLPVNIVCPEGTAYFGITLPITSGGSTTITQTVPISEKANAVDEVSVSPRNRNGSAGNAGNPNAITISDTGIIECKSRKIYFSVDFSLQPGYQYMWEYYLSNTTAFPSYKRVYTLDPHVVIDTKEYKYMTIQVYRRSISDTNVYDPVRVEDVGYYSLKAVYLYNGYEPHEVGNEIDNLNSTLKDLMVGNSPITFDMSNAIEGISVRANGNRIVTPGVHYKYFTYFGGAVTTDCNDRGNGHVAFFDKTNTVIPNSGTTWIIPKKIVPPEGTVHICVTLPTTATFSMIQTVPIAEKVNAVDEVSVSPKNRNGTRPNPGNTDFITINDDGYIESKCNAVRFSVDFDVQSGYQYIWQYYVTEELPFNNQLYHNVLTDVPFVVIDISGSKYVSMQVSRRSKADHTVYDPVRVEDVGYYSLKAVYLYENDKRVGASIIEKNNDVLPAVFAASRYGIHSGGHANTEKKYSLLVTTDVHGSVEAFKSAINYLNKTESIFAGCCLGDIVASYANENAQWYVDAVQKSDKPFFTVIGNHEKGITKDDRALSNTALLAKYITPTENKIGKTGMTTLYYSIYDTEQKICFIILDDYDTPETKDSEGNYYVRRGAECFSQTQIDWFISELENIPSDYHLIILMHSFYNPNTPASCNFTQPGISIVGSTPYLYPASENIIPSIINAWKSGTSLSKTVAPESDYSSLVSSLDISCNFTSRGDGDFICYLVGHMHNDIIAHSTAFPDQLIVCLCATCNDYWQNYNCDLPRIKGTKTEDAITVVGFDTSAKKVNLVRVGSNVTIDMVNRTMISLSY